MRSDRKTTETRKILKRVEIRARSIMHVHTQTHMFIHFVSVCLRFENSDDVCAYVHRRRQSSYLQSPIPGEISKNETLNLC